MPKYDFDSAPIIRPKKQSYDFDSAPIVKSESNVPEWKSALRGAAQGVTSGFADELTAGAESLLTPKSYDQALAESRANYKQAEQANPITYNVGDIAGSIAQPTPFGKLSLATKGGKLALKAAQAGAMGGLETLGKSDDKSTSDFIGGGAASAGLVGGLGGLGKLAGKAKNLLPSKLEVISQITNKPVSGLQAYSDNPKLINKLDALGDTNQLMSGVIEKANKVVDANPFRKAGDKNVKKSYEILDKSDMLISPANPITRIEEQINKLQSLDLPSETQKNALGSLLKKNDELKLLNEKYQGQIPARNVKSILQSLDQDINLNGKWGNPYANDEVGNALKDVRRAFDADLKQVPGYKQVTDKASNYYSQSERFVKDYVNKSTGEADLKKITSSLSSGASEKLQPYNREAIDRLSKAMRLSGEQPIEGLRLPEALSGISKKKMFDAQSNQGSNVMNYAQGIGAGLGALGGATQSDNSVMGIGGGSILGALSGRYLERNAGKLAKKAIDFKNPVPDVLNKVQGTKYGQYLTKAAEQSPRKFAVNMYLLQQKDPEFREMTKGDD